MIFCLIFVKLCDKQQAQFLQPLIELTHLNLFTNTEFTDFGLEFLRPLHNMVRQKKLL